MANAVVPLVGTWIEIQIYQSVFSPPWSFPSWERGLKSPLRLFLVLLFPSFPSWERGLKLCFLGRNNGLLPVVPLVGTWIEIIYLLLVLRLECVVPLVGTWIEIETSYLINLSSSCRSPRGNVD